MRKRNREILLWLSDREFRKLEKDRTAASQTRQKYILELIHRLPPVRCPNPEIGTVSERMENDGRLLNDIARRFNATGQIDINEYVSVLDRLRSNMAKLEEEIANEIRRLDDEERSESKK